ncbi:MAG TPA: recombinase RecT [Sphingomicrobium sp.]|nr:recombinase RecT [Sphingomicrobium sp.]
MSKAMESGSKELVAGDRLETLLDRIDVKKRFDEILGSKAPGFVSSIISAYKGNKALQACPPMSVISSAMVAATLDLPIVPSLGYAHVVPYRENGQPVAQFQIGWKGYVQLAIRTGQYATMNAAEIYADEIEVWNPITGELKIRPQSEWKDRDSGTGKVVGYAAFFRTLNGFEKYLFMTVAQVERHAKKYSKSYQRDSGQWVKDFDAMAKKTVIKLLLSKFGVLSIDMQKALKVDQAVVDAKGEVASYPDAVDAETIPMPPAAPAAGEPDERPVE